MCVQLIKTWPLTIGPWKHIQTLKMHANLGTKIFALCKYLRQSFMRLYWFWSRYKKWQISWLCCNFSFSLMKFKHCNRSYWKWKFLGCIAFKNVLGLVGVKRWNHCSKRLFLYRMKNQCNLKTLLSTMILNTCDQFFRSAYAVNSHNLERCYHSPVLNPSFDTL